MCRGQGSNAVHDFWRDAFRVTVDFHPSFDAIWRGFWSLHQGCTEARPLLPQFMLKNFNFGTPQSVLLNRQLVINKQGLHVVAFYLF